MPGPIGQDFEEMTTPGASGSLNAKMRLMTSQLDVIANKPTASISTSGIMVSLPAVLAVSGNIGQAAGPWAVSGTVSLGDRPLPGTQAVSGTISLGNSPDVGQTRGPWTVSGTVSVGNFPAPGTQTVSGTISVGNSPNVGQTAGPWAVSGTMTVNTHTVSQAAGPWSVSGTVTINTPGTLGVSGSITVGNSPSVGQTAGPWAVSGTVLVGNSPNVGQTAGPWAVSGTMTTQGMTASGAVFSGNPQVIAGLYVSGGVGSQVLVIPLLVDALGRLVVQGAAAAGAAVAGNPVLVAGWDGTSAQNLRMCPINAASLANTAATTPLATHSYLLDGASVWTCNLSARGNLNAVAGANFGAASKMSYNGATFDVDRNNADATSLSAAIRASGSITSADITTYNARGIAVYLDIATASGAFQQFQLTINGKDPASSKYVPMLSGGIVASGGIQPSPTTMAYKIYPGISGNFATPTGVTLQSVVSDHVPRVIQIVLSPVAGINYYYTASIGYTLLY